MGNNLNMDIIDKNVIIDKKYMKEEYYNISRRVFYVEGGFGASSVTSGTMIGGYFQFEGKNGNDSLRGWMVERLATEKEVKDAIKLRIN